MAKVTTIPARDPDDDHTVYEGTRIEIRDMSITIRTAAAKTTYELVYQLQEWATECSEEAARLKGLSQALCDVTAEARDANWFDAAGGETLQDMHNILINMWEGRISELEAKAEAYDDAWTYLATLLDEQDVKEGTTLANARRALRRLLQDANENIDSDDDSLRAWWGGVIQALTVFDRATGASWGLYDEQHVDTDPYFD